MEGAVFPFVFIYAFAPALLAFCAEAAQACPF
jgi:hypothetical protein